MVYNNRDTPNWTVGEAYTQLIGAIMKSSTNSFLRGDIIGYYNDLTELFNSSPFVFNEKEEIKHKADLEKIEQSIMYKEEKKNALGQISEIVYPKRKAMWKVLGDKKRELIRKIYDSDLLIPKRKTTNEDEDNITFFGD